MEDYKRANPMMYGLLKQYAAEMRRFPTEAESVLWNYLKGNALGMGFKRQCVIMDYIADFYCPEKELIIEVDGGYHRYPVQEELDELRTKRLNSVGYKVIRFTNEQVMFDIDNVVEQIDKHLYDET